MRREKEGGLGARVEATGRRVEDWRRTRERRSAMPEDLWGEAVSLAREEGVWRIARALRVSYATLKWRTAWCGAGAERSGVSGSGGFIELAGAGLLGPAAAAGPVVELSRTDGTKLTIRLAGDEGVDVLGLARAFWGRGV